ncbi:MAG TPA: hypothetical protein DCZ92_13875 [Elusimicrobia bacterium]|nr:hypothetical protein [Elusimicrobiota bacterium]
MMSFLRNLSYKTSKGAWRLFHSPVLRFEKKALWLAALLAAVCIGVYANALRNTFLQDDVYNITQNTFIRDAANLPKLFTRDYFRLAQEGAYRPVPTAVLFADYALFGYNPAGYRAVNIAWHLTAVILLFFLLIKFLAPRLGPGRARNAAFLAALLFAVHPVNSQMIGVISYHEDLICFVFMLVSAHLYLRNRLALSLAAFGLALFSKEMAVTLPVILLLYHLLLAPAEESRGADLPAARNENLFASIARRAGISPQWGAVASFFGIAGLFALGRFTLFKPSGIIMESNSANIAHLPSLAEFLRNTVDASVTYARYLGLLVWPGKLSVDWDSVLVHSPASQELLLLSLLLMGGILWLAWRSARRAPWLTFGILYFLVTLLPVSGVIPFWSSMAERYLYIPSLGFFLIAGCALEGLWNKTAGRSWLKAALVLLVISMPAALAWRTVVRNLNYKDELTLYLKETADQPGSYGAWYGLGYALGQHGDYVGAKEAFLKADALDQYHKTHFMLAFTEEKLNGADAVIESEYIKSIALEPEYYPARFNLASFYHKRGKLKEAIPQYEKALQINPGYKEAAANLGAANMADGRFALAAAALARASEIRPELETHLTADLQAKIEHNLATALFNLDKNDAALEHYRRAIALNPALEKKPILKAVSPDAQQGQPQAEVAAASPPTEGRALLSELKKLYPGLKDKWEKAERLEYAATPGGYRPKFGYKGSSQAQENLKPAEQAALDALAAREQAASPFNVLLPPDAAGTLALELEGIRLEQTMAGAKPVPARAKQGMIAYPGSYQDTEVFFISDARSSEQLFLLNSPKAPSRFDGKVSVAGGSLRLEDGGELALYNPDGERKLQLSRPLIIDAKGKEINGGWELKASPKTPSEYLLALAFNPKGLSYPLLVDPVWTAAGAGSLATARFAHTATLLPDGKVLVAGGSGAAALLTAEVYDPAAGTWSATGPLATARYGHTATLLPNGKVLVVGGYTGASELLSAELYDPAAGTWSATGSLATARSYHTATLLPNGKVLVAGGNVGTELFTAELYDPATGIWSVTGSLATARRDCTATLLPNGKVLVAGGFGGGTPELLTAELYDPSGGTWTATGSLATARGYHTATLLPNGKVLVAGGGTGAGKLLTAELYDPAAGTWTATGSLATARGNHAATLLPNGKVLVSAGSAGAAALLTTEVYDPAAGTWTASGSLATARYVHTAILLPNGKVLVSGGTGSGALLTAEVYNPSAGAWSITGSLATAHNWHTATLLPNGKVLVAGGHVGGDSSLLTAEVYDPTGGTWADTGSLATARGYHTATLLPNGKVLVAGGYAGGDSPLLTAEVYDPVAGTWSVTGSLATARNVHTATLLPNGKVLVVGGLTGSSTMLKTAEVYDPAAGTWSVTGPLATARGYHTATLLPNGKVLVAGGYGATYLLTAEIYDPAAGTWSATGSLATARIYHTATLLPNGKVLVAGGDNEGDSSLLTAEVYDPVAGTWTAAGSLATARRWHSATLLPNGKVLVAGGYNGTVTLLTAELYDPAAGTWSATGSLPTARSGHTATLLPNGKVLVAGGAGATALLTAELALYTEYDYSVVASTMQPAISTLGGSSSFPQLILKDTNYTLTGLRFKGNGEGSGGGYTSNSPANYPRVYLQRMDSENLGTIAEGGGLLDVSTSVYPMSSAQWESADTQISFKTPVDLQQGHYLLTVMANAVPSEAKIVSVYEAPPEDVAPPSAAGSLAAGATSTDTVVLNWLAPGDDGNTGVLDNSTFTIQYTSVTADAENPGFWSTNTAQINISTTGVGPGTSQYYTLGGLAADTSYYFRLWTKDDAGNYSPLSNGATVQTAAQSWPVPSGCSAALNVAQDGNSDFTTIQAAVNASTHNLTGDTCIVIRDTAAYSEQVTVQGFTSNGYRLKIMADPGWPSPAPVIDPPEASTAAFNIMCDSVTIQGIDIVPLNSLQYGIQVSSDYIVISSVNIRDINGHISVSGISLADRGLVSNSSVTVQTASQVLGLSSSGSFNTVAHSTITKLGLGYPGSNNVITWSVITAASGTVNALFLDSSSSNTISDSFISNPAGTAFRLDYSNHNSIIRSTMTSNAYKDVGWGGSGFAALKFENSSSNTVTESFMSNPGQNGVVINPGSDYNTISQSTMTSNFYGDYLFYEAALYIYASYNAINMCSILNPSGTAVSVDGGFNTITRSTITSTNSSPLAIRILAHHTTITQSNIRGVVLTWYSAASSNIIAQNTINADNPDSINNSDPANYDSDAAIIIDTSFNTITQNNVSNRFGTGIILREPSMIGLYNVNNDISSNTISSAKDGIHVHSSTGTTIRSNIIVSTNANAAGIHLEGSFNGDISSNTINAGAQGKGINLISNSGIINISSNTIRAAGTGIYISTQQAGAEIHVTTLTFTSLAAGATGIEFASGTFISTFTGVYFNDLNMGTNVYGALLEPGSRIAMRDAAGAKAGSGYENDPAGYVDWLPDPYSPPSGCGPAETRNVGKTGYPYSTIQAAVNSLTVNMSTTACVVIRDTQTYTEQVTVQGFNNNGYRLKIMADPGLLGLAPVIDPPAASTAAFNIMCDSVTIQGIDIVPLNSLQYGIQVSSDYVVISSVNIRDIAGHISVSGISLSSYSVVSNSSVTVQTASQVFGLSSNGSFNVVAHSTITKLMLGYPGSNNVINWSVITAASGTVNALFLDNSSSNTISDSFISNPAGTAFRLDYSNHNSIIRSTMTSNAYKDVVTEFAGFAALKFGDSSSSNTVTESFMSNPGQNGVVISPGSKYNAISQSTMTSNFYGVSDYESALVISDSFNTINRCFVSNPFGIAIMVQGGFNTISQSTITSNGIFPYAIMLAAHHTLITQSNINGVIDIGYSNYGDSNIITQNTISADNPVTVDDSDAAVFVVSASNTITQNAISNRYGKGIIVYEPSNDISNNTISSAKDGINVHLATGTTIRSNIIVSTNANATGIHLEGSFSGDISSNTISAGAQGKGINLVGNGGTINISSNTIREAGTGIHISTQQAGAEIRVTTLTLTSLAAGATGIEFASGTFISTFTGVLFNDPNMGTNVYGALLNSGSRITMRDSSGPKTGSLYETDPGGYVDWVPDAGTQSTGTLSPASFSGVGTSSLTVNWGGTYFGGTVYHVRLSTAANASAYISSASTAGTSYGFAGLMPNREYYGFVSTSAVSGFMLTDHAYTLANIPLSPSTAAVYATSATVTWGLNGNSDGTTAKVMRRLTGVETGNTFTTNTTSYTDTGLLGCTTYDFLIYNVNRAGVNTTYASVLSVLTGNPVSLPPGNFTAQSLSGYRIALAWEPPPYEGITGYSLYYDNATSTISYASTLATFTAGHISYIATMPGAGNYKFGLRAVHRCGMEDGNTRIVAMAPALYSLTGVKAAIKIPQSGKKINGNSVTVMAELVLGAEADVRNIRFDYKISTAPDSAWAAIPPKNAATHPNPDPASPYFILWNVDGMAQTSYDLRAVATDRGGVADPAPAAITVNITDQNNADIKENASGNTVTKEQDVSSLVSNTIQTGDGDSQQMTTLVLPAYALDTDTAAVSVTNNPNVALTVPADVQSAGVVVEISLSNSQTQLANGQTAEVTLVYSDVDNDGKVDDTTLLASQLVMYSAESPNGPWASDLSSVVDPANKKVKGSTSHFSYFALFAPMSADLNSAKVYPVPWKPGSGGRFDSPTGVAGVVFDNLTAAAEIRIYTIAGGLVRKLDVSASDGGYKVWDGKNSSGSKVASGIYLAHIKSGSKVKILKVAIER